MKQLIITALTLFIHLAYAQQKQGSLDTVFCDAKNTSYLVFAQKVSLCDLGYPDDYAAQVNENMVFVKALKNDAAPTTLLIRTDESIYFGMLKCVAHNQKYYYDFKNIFENIKEKAEIDNKSTDEKKKNTHEGEVNNSEIQVKSERFLKIKNELSTLGFVSPALDASLALIRNSDNNTYLKLILLNKSSIAYKLDFISFRYFEDMEKGFMRKSRKAPLDVFPVLSPGTKEIPAGKSETLCYVIPGYGLHGKGYLMIMVRESSGDRVLKIKVGGHLLQSSPQL